MAMMYNCATDWTFDRAYADAQKASALPMRHGVRRRNLSCGEELFTYLKTVVKFTECDEARPWDDSWQQNIDWSWVSDWYKDAYGQRPHFSDWYWRGLLGVYQPTVDFCSPEETMRQKCEVARYTREHLLDY